MRRNQPITEALLMKPKKRRQRRVEPEPFTWRIPINMIAHAKTALTLRGRRVIDAAVAYVAALGREDELPTLSLLVARVGELTVLEEAFNTRGAPKGGENTGQGLRGHLAAREAMAKLDEQAATPSWIESEIKKAPPPVTWIDAELEAYDEQQEEPATGTAADPAGENAVAGAAEPQPSGDRGRDPDDLGDGAGAAAEPAGAETSGSALGDALVRERAPEPTPGEEPAGDAGLEGRDAAVHAVRAPRAQRADVSAAPARRVRERRVRPATWPLIDSIEVGQKYVVVAIDGDGNVVRAASCAVIALDELGPRVLLHNNQRRWLVGDDEGYVDGMVGKGSDGAGSYWTIEDIGPVRPMSQRAKPKPKPSKPKPVKPKPPPAPDASKFASSIRIMAKQGADAAKIARQLKLPVDAVERVLKRKR